MAYKQSPINFGVGTGRSPLKNVEETDMYAPDGEHKNRKFATNPEDPKWDELRDPSKSYDSGPGSGMGGVNREERDVEQSMSDVNVGDGGGKSGDEGADYSYSYSQALGDWQGGDLTRRQQRLIKKGKTGKAHSIGSRRRSRVLKRGGEVASSIRQGSHKDEYKQASRVQSKEGYSRLESGPGRYNYKKSNKSRGAGGGFLGRIFGRRK
tara:strand:+ start:1891 stop:2517 length:627 start_codon:yes stop_codon:yes gene_type:complete